MKSHGTTTATQSTLDVAQANRLGALAHELVSEIRINAPIDVVWAVLTDLDHYHEWNPFVIDASGRAEEGAELPIRIQPVGGRAASLKPTVTEVVPGRTFEWLGRIISHRLFTARHRFELVETGDGATTRLRHSEHFTGPLVPLLRKTLTDTTLPGFVLMNEALMRRAEAITGQG